MIEWKALFESLKLPTRYFAILLVISGAALFLSDEAMTRLHLLDLRQRYASWLGGAFLLSVGVCAVSLAEKVGSWVGGARSAKRKRGATARRVEEIKARFSRMSYAEQAVIREIVIWDKPAAKLPAGDPVVASLVEDGILQQVGALGELSPLGPLLSFRLNRDLMNECTPAALGLGRFARQDASGREILSPDASKWISENRPPFAPAVANHERLFRGVY